MREKATYCPAALSSKVAWLWTTLLCVSGSASQAQTPGREFINPPGLTRPTGYTHVVVSADHRTAYVAGQVAFDSTGMVVGVGDFQAQAEQVFTNLRLALASVGASFADVVKTTGDTGTVFRHDAPAGQHPDSGCDIGTPGLAAGNRGGGGSPKGGTAVAVGVSQPLGERSG